MSLAACQLLSASLLHPPLLSLSPGVLSVFLLEVWERRSLWYFSYSLYLFVPLAGVH